MKKKKASYHSTQDPLKAWERHVLSMIESGECIFSREVVLRRVNKKDKD